MGVLLEAESVEEILEKKKKITGNDPNHSY
mgnify:CR=1 FL=1